MEKKYNLPEDNSDKNIIHEPAIEYDIQPEAETETPSPLPEDFHRGITKDELMEGIKQDLRKLYNK